MNCRIFVLSAVAVFVLPITTSGQRAPYPHRSEPIGTVRQIYDGVLTPEMAVNTFRNIDRLFPTRTVAGSSRPLPLPRAAVSLTDLHFSDQGKQYDLESYLELNRIAAILILQDGRVKLERYRFGNTDRTRWMSMSIAKSITSTLVGAALKDGFIRSLSDSVTRYVPSLKGTAYDGVSVQDVLMMASGVRWNETYSDPTSDRRRLLEAQISQVAGAALAVMQSLPGVAAGDSILPAGWVREATTPQTLRDGAAVEYGYLWWTGATPASRRDGAFMAIGIHGQYLYVNPVAKIVIVVWGARPHPSQGQVVDDWSFCDAVTATLARGRTEPE